MQINVFTTTVLQVRDSTTYPASKKYSVCMACTKLCYIIPIVLFVRQTSPAVECQITDIHSVAHHQWLVPAVEHWVSELTSSDGSVVCDCSSDPLGANDPVYQLP